MAESITASAFRRKVWAHYRAHGRHDLPWRTSPTLYRVLVSEVMLQQTPVERVVPLYQSFLKQFPSAKRLASAPLSDVLRAWQGLGYNRRAKMLREAAAELVDTARFVTRLNLVTELEKLPGVGPYTARAVAAFAQNSDGIVIETNIRTAVTHHFFPHARRVSDRDIARVLARVMPQGRAREWYSALMDYGASLKRSGFSYNSRSQSYTKQAPFRGSLREARGAILRELAIGSQTEECLGGLLGGDRRTQIKQALDALVAEELVQVQKGRYRLPH